MADNNVFDVEFSGSGSPFDADFGEVVAYYRGIESMEVRADGTIVITKSDGSTQEFDEIQQLFTQLSAALVFKGVITSESQLPAEHHQGDLYMVGAAGTYLGQVCEPGDIIICVVNGSTAQASDWTIVQTNLNPNLFAPKASPVFTGSISLGRKANTTVGTNSFAVGNDVEASGNYSHAEGSSLRVASYTYKLIASGDYSHAEGAGSRATGEASHAEGAATIASGNHSHSEGSYTNAQGAYSHSEGRTTSAQGAASHSEGLGTVALGEAQHVGGKYNVTDSESLEIIGNGTSSDAKKNARLLDANGNERLKGDIYVNCNDDSTGGNKVATENIVMSIFDHATEYVPKISPAFFYGTWYHEKGTGYLARLNESKAPATLDQGAVYQVIGDSPYHIPTSSNSIWLVYTLSDAVKYINDFQNNVADIFYSGLIYEEGHYVSYNGVIYKRKSWGNVTPVAKAWDESDWEKAEVANELAPKSNPVFTGSISLGRREGFATGASSFAVGRDVIASGDYSHAEGDLSQATYNAAHAEGLGSKAEGLASHAEGMATIAAVGGQHAGGRYNVRDTNSLEVIGNGSSTSARKNARLLDFDGNERLAGDIYVNCEIDSTGGTALGAELGNKAPKANPEFTGSISLGRRANTTVGENSCAVGYEVEASGLQSHAEGSFTIASGGSSHAEGYNTTADEYSHAEGYYSMSSGMSSHAEGGQTTASGDYSHAEGYFSTASGDNSHAEGSDTKASAQNAHAEGLGTTALGEAQHVGGKYNVTDNSSLEIIGNGTRNNARKNARLLDANGNEKLKGNLYVNCNDDSTGGSIVATQAYVDNSTTAITNSDIDALF